MARLTLFVLLLAVASCFGTTTMTPGSIRQLIKAAFNKYPELNKEMQRDPKKIELSKGGSRDGDNRITFKFVAVHEGKAKFPDNVCTYVGTHRYILLSRRITDVKVTVKCVPILNYWSGVLENTAN